MIRPTRKCILTLFLLALIATAPSCAYSESETTSHAAPTSARTTLQAAAKLEVKYVPVQTLDALISNSSHIFIGTYRGKVTVEGVTSWVHDVYDIERMVKSASPLSDSVFQIISSEKIPVERKPGEKYLVFALMADVVIFSVPIVAYTADFLLNEGCIDLSNESLLRQYYPFIDDTFVWDPLKSILSSPEIHTVPKDFIERVKLEADNADEWVKKADLIIKSTFTVVEVGAEGTFICEVGQDIDILKDSDRKYTIPCQMVLPIKPAEGEEYILFLQVTQNNSLLLLSPRAMISRRDRKEWDVAITIISNKIYIFP